MSWDMGVRTATAFLLLTISFSRIFPGETPSPSEGPWNLVLKMSEHQKGPAKSSCKPTGVESGKRGVQAESTLFPLYSSIRYLLSTDTAESLGVSTKQTPSLSSQS